MHNGRRDQQTPVDATANTRAVIGPAAWRSRQRPRWRHPARAACRALLRARRARRSAGRRREPLDPRIVDNRIRLTDIRRVFRDPGTALSRRRLGPRQLRPPTTSTSVPPA